MHLSTFADPDRVRFIALLTGTRRPFDGSVVLRGDGGTKWSCTRLGSYVAAVPFERLESGAIRLGRLAERLLWHVHYCVRESRRRQVQLHLHHIREVLWGADSFPKNWRGNLLKVIGSLSKIRVGAWPTEGVALRIEETKQLFDDVELVELERLITFEIGEGFLGSLEQFNDGKGGLDWPKDSELRRLRQGNANQEIYLPVFLGRREPCDRITPRQKGMLQVILSEVTFERRQKSDAGRRKEGRVVEEFVGSDVPDYLGDHQVGCPVLATNSRHVGFNGNGVRRGQGYKLQTWLSRSGYQSVELVKFVDDIEVLGMTLGIAGIAIQNRSNRWFTLSDIRSLVAQQQARVLESLCFRFYITTGYLDRWNAFFGLEADEDRESFLAPTDPEVDALRSLVCDKSLRITRTQVAPALGVSRQFIGQVIDGTKSCPARLRAPIQDLIRLVRETGSIDDIRVGSTPPTLGLTSGDDLSSATTDSANSREFAEAGV
jgi:hypothetical protein